MCLYDVILEFSNGICKDNKNFILGLSGLYCLLNFYENMINYDYDYNICIVYMIICKKDNRI